MLGQNFQFPGYRKEERKFEFVLVILTFLLIVSEFHFTNYSEPIKIVRISC